MTGPMPSLRAREQVEDGLGQDVRRAVAHRPELAGRAVVHELRRAAALGRVELDRLLVDLVLLVVGHVGSPENHETPRPVQDERFDPPAVPPAFAGRVGRRALWPR